MKIWDTILTFTKKRKEDNFWRTPDVYLAAIILNKEREQVYGMVKKNFALLERIPKPESGFFYRDVVKVKGPIGKQYFRDDEIDEYEVVELHKPSDVPTFTFKAIIPNSNDYFNLLDFFKKYGHKVELAWSEKEINKEWRKGYCTAENLDHAKELLHVFIDKNKGQAVKEIDQWNK